MATLRDDDPLLHSLIGTNDFSRSSSPTPRSQDPFYRALNMGIGIKEADRAVTMARHYGVPVERFIEDERRGGYRCWSWSDLR